MQLYTYWRSSAAYRLRIALNIKGVKAEHIPVHLTKDGGEQFAASYKALNASASVPTLITDDGRAITQSLAAIEYLDETIPTPPLLPQEPIARAKVRSLALIVAADIHPINNLRVSKYLKDQHQFSDQAIMEWMQHWMRLGLTAFQEMAAKGAPFSTGEMVSLADICLIPQLYNARRWQLDLAPFDGLLRIEENCLAMEAFANAHPSAQLDAQ